VIARLRRLLVIPAVGLVLVGAPALAWDRSEPPAPTTTEVPMAPAASALDADTPGAWSAEADVSANLVGVEWSGDPGAEFTIEVRDHDGSWKAVGTVGVIDVAPDPGSSDARSAAGRCAVRWQSVSSW
jgi:hypothetical protein